MLKMRVSGTDELTLSHNRGRSPSCSRPSTGRSSSERCGTPVRLRPLSPIKSNQLKGIPADRSEQLLQLAAKERALSELKESRKELDLQIAQAELDIAHAKRQVTCVNSPLQSLSYNTSNRNILQRDREMEALQHLADGVTAIWKDVVQATIGEQATI